MFQRTLGGSVIILGVLALSSPLNAQHNHSMMAPSGAVKAVPAPPVEASMPGRLLATAEIIGTDRSPLGMAEFREGPSGVLVRIALTGSLPTGWRGMHFHAVGTCDDAAFATAGAHVNHTDPTSKKGHGLLAEVGPDFGDLPNLYTGADGKTFGEAFSSLVTFSGAAGRAALFDADGTSLVIHANADDHLSQPIGGAGARVGCGVLKRAP
jgi:superoxide dismutase, Cu-Zn family